MAAIGAIGGFGIAGAEGVVVAGGRAGIGVGPCGGAGKGEEIADDVHSIVYGV